MVGRVHRLEFGNIVLPLQYGAALSAYQTGVFGLAAAYGLNWMGLPVCS